jgi:predicted  nucleic acid-binding Zn-ribbon protein
MSEHLNDFSINILCAMEKKLDLVKDLIANQLDKIEKRLDKVESHYYSDGDLSAIYGQLRNIEKNYTFDDFQRELLTKRIEKLEYFFSGKIKNPIYEAIEMHIEKFNERIEKLEDFQKHYDFKLNIVGKAINELTERIEKLENGFIKGKKCPICYGKDLCNPCKMD